MRRGTNSNSEKQVTAAPRERSLMLCRGTVAATEWGPPDGSLVLCWHGAGGSADDYANLGLALAFRLGVRVVAVDAPGHARSPSRPADEFRPSSLATLAVSILDELGVAQATFVGFSWGGSIGCWFGALFPRRTRALVLIDGGHLDFADLPGFQVKHDLNEFVEEARVAAAAEGPAFGNHTPQTAGAMVWGLCAEPATATYSRLTDARLPILFVGRRDEGRRVLDPVERLCRRVPQTATVEVPTTSHELLRDAREAIAEVVLSWLAEQAS